MLVLDAERWLLIYFLTVNLEVQFSSQLYKRSITDLVGTNILTFNVLDVLYTDVQLALY